MGRRSSIGGHPQRAAIERAISEGVPGVEIARRYTLSESSISRHKLLRNDALGQLADVDAPAPSDLLQRLLELADDARQARRITAVSGTPVARARAQASELAALTALLDRLGVTDVAILEAASGVELLVRALANHIVETPEHAAGLLAALGAHEDLEPLVVALTALTERNRR
jgi:hypothetical protein